MRLKLKASVSDMMASPALAASGVGGRHCGRRMQMRRVSPARRAASWRKNSPRPRIWRLYAATVCAASNLYGSTCTSGPAKERGVRTSHTAFGTVPETTDDRDARCYAPRDFLRQFGSVIAVCLGLALLAHVLVALVGVY